MIYTTLKRLLDGLQNYHLTNANNNEFAFFNDDGQGDQRDNEAHPSSTKLLLVGFWFCGCIPILLDLLLLLVLKLKL